MLCQDMMRCDNVLNNLLSVPCASDAKEISLAGGLAGTMSSLSPSGSEDGST